MTSNVDSSNKISILFSLQRRPHSKLIQIDWLQSFQLQYDRISACPTLSCVVSPSCWIFIHMPSRHVDFYISKNPDESINFLDQMTNRGRARESARCRFFLLCNWSFQNELDSKVTPIRVLETGTLTRTTNAFSSIPRVRLNFYMWLIIAYWFSGDQFGLTIIGIFCL